MNGKLFDAVSVESMVGKHVRRVSQRTLNLQANSAMSVLPSSCERKLLLYVHVPFCETLCAFCTFHRVRFDASLATRYFSAVRTEILRYHNDGFKFSDVYFGGGTPTVVPDELTRTLTMIRDLGFSGKVSVETNPNHLRPEIIDELLGAGVNRLSVGVQSFDDQLLREMGRYERYGSGSDIAARLKSTQGQFETLNVDLIFNFPHQNAESLSKDIEILKEIGVDQVSYYPLMPATETRRAMSRQMGEVNFHNEKEVYYQILDQMGPEYQASSAWCFTRGSAMIDEYIVDHDEYLGVGSGSFSYLNGTLYSTSFSIKRYINRVARGHTGIVMQRTFKLDEQQRYTLLVGLFGLQLPTKRLTQLYGGSARAVRRILLIFRALGAVCLDGDTYRLTRRGQYLWIVMMREFLMGVNQFREQMRHHIRLEQYAGQQETAIPPESIGNRSTRMPES